MGEGENLANLVVGRGGGARFRGESVLTGCCTQNNRRRTQYQSSVIIYKDTPRFGRQCMLQWTARYDANGKKDR
jgi:hypothetical protein